MLAAIIAVACGGALGSVARFLSITLVQNLTEGRYPFGTLFVNSTGSFLVGFIMVLLLERVASTDYWRLFLVVGFLGGYTTFSSFSWETWMLYKDGETVAALLNILVTNVFALSMTLLGVLCARWIGGTV